MFIVLVFSIHKNSQSAICTKFLKCSELVVLVMLTKKKMNKTYNPITVTSIFLLSMMLGGSSIVEDRQIVIAQANNTLNAPDKSRHRRRISTWSV